MDFDKSLGNWQGGTPTLAVIFQTGCDEYKWLNNEAWNQGDVWHVKPIIHMFPTYGKAPRPGIREPECFWAKQM